MFGFKQLRLLIVLPVTVLIIGTIGFMVLEDLSFVDAFYFTIVTISTVGYGDIHPTSAASKGFGIFMIIVGIGTFLAIITNVTQWLIQRGQNKIRRHRLNMLIGVFFTEAGNGLLRVFTQFDPHIDTVRKEFLVTVDWSGGHFHQLRKRLADYDHTIDRKILDLNIIHDFLSQKGELFIRELENPDLVENEGFTELLWAVVHLRDELLARDSLENLPESDMGHLAVDVTRAYTLLTRHWISYLEYMKTAYPFLFSLALRTNPFVKSPSAIIR